MTAALIDLAERRRVRRAGPASPTPAGGRASAAPRMARSTPRSEDAQAFLTEAELRGAVESLRRTILGEPTVAASCSR